MKIGRLTLVCAVASLLYGGTVSAQQFTRGAPSSPSGTSTTRLVAYENTKYYAPAEASPSDAATPAAPAAPAPEAPAAEAPAAEAEEDTFEPVHIFGNVPFLKEHKILVGGWVAGGFVWNPQNPQDKFNGPVTWMDRANEGMLNELWTYVGKAADNEGEGFAFGYRVDTLYGESARLTTSAGLEDRINKSQSFYGLAIPNLYLETAYNDMKVKYGHFISPVGFYTVGTYNNFFNTIPYTYQWGEPFTHTGILTSWQMTDNVNWGAGIIRGWDNSFQFNPSAGYLGTLTVNNVLKEGDSAAYVQVVSREPNGGFENYGAAIPPGGGPSIQYPGKPTFATRYFQTFVYSRPVTDKITYVFQSDFGVQQQAATITNNFQPRGTARWYGVNQYVYYKHNNCWSWGGNFEWFRDESGFRVGGFLPNYANTTNGGPSNTRGWGSNAVTGQTIGGFAGNFFQTTWGPRWTPNPNLVIRPNLRWDWYAGQRGVGNTLPYDAGTSHHQFVWMNDLIVVY